MYKELFSDAMASLVFFEAQNFHHFPPFSLLSHLHLLSLSSPLLFSSLFLSESSIVSVVVVSSLSCVVVVFFLCLVLSLLLLLLLCCWLSSLVVLLLLVGDACS